MPKQKVCQQGKFSVYPEDIIIVVMGPYGSGKSHLIESFHGEKGSDLRISRDSLSSSTKSISAYRLEDHPMYGNRVVLVDTPGFSDTNESEKEVLQMVGMWLDRTYRQSNKQTMIAAILYLHPITGNFITGQAIGNLAMIVQLCGPDVAQKVALVVTFCDTMINKQDIISARISRLKRLSWRNLIDLGSRVEIFTNSLENANFILGKIVESEEKRKILHIQEEAVRRGMHIRETDAARTLHSNHHGLLMEQRSLDDLKELKIGFFTKLALFLRFKKPVSSVVDLRYPDQR